MIDFNRTPKDAFADAFVATINAAMEKDNQAQPRRPYLGGSRLGEECARMLQYEYSGAPKSRQFPGEVLRIFDRGHDSEARMIRRFKLAGFQIVTEGRNGGQIGFDTAQGRIKGHADGVITAAPIDMKTPALWEHKCLGSKAWNATAKNGVRKEKPVYAGQIATYQAYLQLTDAPALFTAENADNGQLYAELVPFDPALAQACTDRGVQVIQATEAGETLPRPYASSDFYKCRLCDYQKECWS